MEAAPLQNEKKPVLKKYLIDDVSWDFRNNRKGKQEDMIVNFMSARLAIKCPDSLVFLGVSMRVSVDEINV